MAEPIALVLGDGLSYHTVANRNFRSFKGLLIVAHYYRHSPDVIVSIDPRSFNEKEKQGIGRCRVVIAMSHWAQRMGLRQKVPADCRRKVEWDWIDEPKLTSGFFGILWAAKQGYKEIYTAGVDLTPGYHRSLDTCRYILSETLSKLRQDGVTVYKRSSLSSLPVPIKEPPLIDLSLADKAISSSVVSPWAARQQTTDGRARTAPWQRRPRDGNGITLVSSRSRRRPFQKL